MDYSSSYETSYASSPAVAINPLVSLFLWVIILAIYVYTAYCFYIIAKKTNTPNAWLAWIPFANLFLMLKIARLSYWWFLAFLVPLFNIGVAVYIYMKIAERRGRPQWVGLLMLLPVVNFVVIGYLAFSDAPAGTVSPPPPVPSPTSNPQI